MATASKVVQLNDSLTVFKVRVTENGVPVDISTATLMNIKFRKPGSSTTVVQVASFFTDGTDGYMKYAVQAGDIDQVGLWRLQGYVEMPTWKGHTRIGEFEVEENL